MELPAPLRAAVDRMLEGVALADLQRASAQLTSRYRSETRDGRLHLDGDLTVKAYLAARLPATYAAVRSSLAMIEEAAPDFAPPSLLDVGAGPGTALWAAKDAWSSIGSAQMLEASEPVRRAGAALAASQEGVSANWQSGDATRTLAESSKADLVTLCYVLDELAPAEIAPLVERLWTSTGQMLVIVEPGTPAGWRRILEARACLIALGAHIVAPCPHEAPCPLAAPDWCHLSRRVARSRIHRQAKGGDVPWEDEKFIFVAASRTAPTTRAARVLAPPRQGKAWIDLKCCQPDGTCAELRIAKRQPDAYRAARKLDWGDALPPGITE